MRYEASELVPVITMLSCCFNTCKALFIPVWKSLFVEVQIVRQYFPTNARLPCMVNTREPLSNVILVSNT